MEELNDLELMLLSGLATKHPSFKAHIPYVKVDKRESTGVGMCVNLVYVDADGKIILTDLQALFSNGENIQTKNLKYGLSYVIDITDGEIKYIEFTTYGENWDGKFIEWKMG